MQISVHLHTLLQRQTPSGYQSRLSVELPEGATLARLLRELQVTMEVEHLLLVVNGKAVEPEHMLREGDEVHLIPAISGG